MPGGGLKKFSSDGHEIAYTVTEDPVDGYDLEITSDAAEGFMATNTLREVPKENPKSRKIRKSPMCRSQIQRRLLLRVLEVFR